MKKGAKEGEELLLECAHLCGGLGIAFFNGVSKMSMILRQSLMLKF